MVKNPSAAPRLRQLSLFDLWDTLAYVAQATKTEQPTEGEPIVKGRLLYARSIAFSKWHPRPPRLKRGSSQQGTLF